MAFVGLASVAFAGEEDIRSHVAEYYAVWHAGDAKALAEFFTEDGDRINGRGMILRGRAAIRDHYSEVFARDVERALEYEVLMVRVVAPGIAVVDLKYEVIGVGPDPTRLIRGISTVTLVENNGRWLRAAHRNIAPLGEKVSSD